MVTITIVNEGAVFQQCTCNVFMTMDTSLRERNSVKGVTQAKREREAKKINISTQ